MEIFADGFFLFMQLMVRYCLPSPVCDGVLNHVPLTFPDVVKKHSVNPGSSMGPDGMHPSLLLFFSCHSFILNI